MDPGVRRSAAVITAVSILGTLFVVLRLWTRYVIVRALGLDDLLISLAWLCAATMSVFIGPTIAINTPTRDTNPTGRQIVSGLGIHMATISHPQIRAIMFNFYITIPTYFASLGFIKLAILMQYRRVFTSPKFLFWNAMSIRLVIAYMLSSVIGAIFVCWPINKYWDVVQIEGWCADMTAWWYANATLNIVSDVLIIMMPMPVIKSLKLARKPKFVLMGVFALGLVVCVVSIMRLKYLYGITHTHDLTYENRKAATLSAVEVYLALVCACTPTLRPIFSKWRAWLEKKAQESDSVALKWLRRGDSQREGRDKGSSDTELIQNALNREPVRVTSGEHAYRVGTSSTMGDDEEVMQLGQLQPAKTRDTPGVML